MTFLEIFAWETVTKNRVINSQTSWGISLDAEMRDFR